MRTAAFAGLFVFAFIANNGPLVSATAIDVQEDKQHVQLIATARVLIEEKTLSKLSDKEPNRREEISRIYVVLEGDTLYKIAENHKTSWQRIFYKNIQIDNPDIIKVGDRLTIPTPDEKLEERPLPSSSFQAESSTIKRSSANYDWADTDQPANFSYLGSSSGNSYYPGYCTWYAKNKRPDLPNNLGNANNWVSGAAAQGIPTGSTPRAGAIGQQGMHVVYVEKVNGDGTVTISDMNYSGLFVITTRTVPAASFQYIY